MIIEYNIILIIIVFVIFEVCSPNPLRKEATAKKRQISKLVAFSLE